MKHLHQNFATVGLLSCARESATQQPTPSPVAENPAVASPAVSAPPSQTAQTSPIASLDFRQIFDRVCHSAIALMSARSTEMSQQKA